MDYKKILEGVVDIINTTEKSDIGFANICTYIGENFPELKESKGERTRKEILDYIIKGSESLYDVQQYGKEKFEKWIAWLEKQAEQKPTIEMITPEESLGVDSDTYNKIVDECIYGEQKPTWSEEDENRFNNLIFLVEFSDESKATKEGFIKFINKLKSLRPQNTWKPSESDILLLEKIANGKSNPQDFQASLWGLIGQLKKLRE